MEDSNLTCRDCKQGFVFTAGEQAFFSERNFGPPVRCKGCRESRKANAPRPSVPREPVVQRVAERYHAPHPRSDQPRRGYDARPQQRWEDDQPAKIDRHASKKRKHRHDHDDDDYDW